MRGIATFVFTGVLLLGAIARAEDILTLTATTTTGAPTTISVGGSSVVDLTENLIEQQADFAAISGQAYQASLTYAGAPGAILYEQNAAGTSMTLSFPSIGFTKTFTGADKAAVQAQVDDFLKKAGAATIAAFTQVMAEVTVAGVTDGNPLAITNILARESFNQFGLHPVPFAPDGVDAKKDKNGNFEIYSYGGYVSSDRFDGYYADVTLGGAYYFNQHVGIVLTLPIIYRSIEGAEIWEAALQLGLPITIIPGKGDRTFSWTVSPSGGVAGAASYDLVSGGLIWDAQITSSLGYQLGKWNLVMANQYGYYHGASITIGGYEFDTKVDQSIIRNGLQATYSFNSNFFADANVAYTNLLTDAKVGEYWSPGFGVGWRFGKGFSNGLRVAYNGDFGPDFAQNGGSVSLYFTF